MKKIRRKKILTVQGTSAENFDERFNEASESLPETAELKWDTAPMCVHFIYEEVISVPETIAEEFELQGVHYFCKDCPHLQKGKDKRCKSHGCKYSKYGTVQDFTPACEFFYKQLLQGEIEPEAE